MALEAEGKSNRRQREGNLGKGKRGKQVPESSELQGKRHSFSPWRGLSHDQMFIKHSTISGGTYRWRLWAGAAGLRDERSLVPALRPLTV